jgi:hypothetical protein
MDKFERDIRRAAATLGVDPDKPVVTVPRLVAGDPEHVARALMDGKPASAELTRFYRRVLREHVAG